MKTSVVSLLCAFGFALFALADDVNGVDSSAERTELVAKLEKVKGKLKRFDKSKDRFFLENHVFEIRRLRKERELLEDAIARLDQAKAKEDYERTAPAERARLEGQWEENRNVDISGMSSTNAAPAAALPVPFMTEGPLWTRGVGMGYTEESVVAVSGKDRRTLWLVRKEYDAEGRLLKVVPVKESVRLGD